MLIHWLVSSMLFSLPFPHPILVPTLLTYLLYLALSVSVCLSLSLSLSVTMLLFFLRPCYGLIFLFKWDRNIRDDGKIDADAAQNIFFAKQVITNACGTQALISVLLNRDDIELGDTLTNFKSFAASLPPDIRGEMLQHSDEIRTSHNSFARPEPFIVEEKVATEDDDVFHFVSYVPVNGALYEIDGLKAGPVNLGACTLENWLDVAVPAIQNRMQQYSEKEVRFNLLGIIKDRRVVFKSKLDELNERKTAVESVLATIKAGNTPMDTDAALPSTEDECNSTLQILATEAKGVTSDLEAEERRHEQWRLENVRRRHNYVPFVYNLLTKLAGKGKLGELMEAGKAQQREAMERAQKARAEQEKSSSS
jgi:ubiquitin carboxyl-terminal hydrolase L5